MSERHKMRKIRDVLRLKDEASLSQQQIGLSAALSRSSASHPYGMEREEWATEQ
jgi:hypothetical protein